MPLLRFWPRRARQAPTSLPRDAEDRAPVFEQDAPDRPEVPGGQARRPRRWGRAGGTALTVLAAGGAFVWGRRRRR